MTEDNSTEPTNSAGVPETEFSPDPDESGALPPSRWYQFSPMQLFLMSSPIFCFLIFLGIEVILNPLDSGNAFVQGSSPDPSLIQNGLHIAQSDGSSWFTSIFTSPITIFTTAGLMIVMPFGFPLAERLFPDLVRKYLVSDPSLFLHDPDTIARDLRRVAALQVAAASGSALFAMAVVGGCLVMHGGLPAAAYGLLSIPAATIALIFVSWNAVRRTCTSIYLRLGVVQRSQSSHERQLHLDQVIPDLGGPLAEWPSLLRVHIMTNDEARDLASRIDHARAITGQDLYSEGIRKAMVPFLTGAARQSQIKALLGRE